MSTALENLVNGLALAVIYALVALGITLVFGLTRIVDFAHGSLVMMAAMLSTTMIASTHMSFALAAVVGIVFAGAVSGVMYLGLFRHTLTRPLNGFIVSLGLLLILDNGALHYWGGNARNVNPPVGATLVIGGFRVAEERILTVVVGIVVFALFFVLLQKTAIGAATRALADDHEASSWMGIPVGRLILVVFIVGGVLAGLAGIMYEGLFPVNTTFGDSLVLYGFVVALVGGLGNPLGSLLAAVPIGLVQTYLGPTSYAQWDDAFAFAIVVICLLIRPSGLLRGRAATAHE